MRGGFRGYRYCDLVIQNRAMEKSITCANAHMRDALSWDARSHQLELQLGLERLDHVHEGREYNGQAIRDGFA